MSRGLVKHLAASLGRRDERPNIELAQRIAHTNDKADIEELLNVIEREETPLRRNALKVIFETARINPALVRPHLERLLPLLEEKDNPLVWRTLQIFDTLTPDTPEFMMRHLDAILNATDRSSVIARDRTMSILSQLNALTRFRPTITPILLMRLRHAAPNQFPTYAELAFAGLHPGHREELATIITQRLQSIAAPAKRARLKKLLTRINAPAPDSP